LWQVFGKQQLIIPKSQLFVKLIEAAAVGERKGSSEKCNRVGKTFRCVYLLNINVVFCNNEDMNNRVAYGL